MPEVKNFPDSKEKEERVRSIVDKGDGRKYKWTKLDMDKFKVVAQQVSNVECIKLRKRIKFHNIGRHKSTLAVPIYFSPYFGNFWN